MDVGGGQAGAGEGNRTLVVSLGSFCSAIELHPHSSIWLHDRTCFAVLDAAERSAGWPVPHSPDSGQRYLRCDWPRSPVAKSAKPSPNPIRTGRDICAADPRRWPNCGACATLRTGRDLPRTASGLCGRRGCKVVAERPCRDLPMPVDSINRIGALDRNATRSISSCPPLNLAVGYPAIGETV